MTIVSPNDIPTLRPEFGLGAPRRQAPITPQAKLIATALSGLNHIRNASAAVADTPEQRAGAPRRPTGTVACMAVTKCDKLQV